MTRAVIYAGDCLDVLTGLADEFVDAVVTDPPYELGFMGRAWDASGIAYNVDLWKQCFRVLKPGGHLLAFGGTRTSHRLTCAIEDAGFEIRDEIAWLYGSGFPKSLDVSKAIDKAAGAEREVVGKRTDGRYAYEFSESASRSGGLMGEPSVQESRGVITAPATDDAKRWAGWGTALKPSHEPVVVARKPLVGTVAANVLAHGTGALNIDACRVGDEVMRESRMTQVAGGVLNANGRDVEHGNWQQRPNENPAEHVGRWPTNVVLDEVAAAELDEQSEASSRFFPVFRYQAKAPTRERPKYWRPSCDCETVKPWSAAGSPGRVIDDSGSGVEPSWSMSTSGSESTAEPCPPGTTSTTETATNSTTIPETFNSSPSSSTSESIPAANSAGMSGGSPAAFVGSSSRSTPSIGTSRRKDGRSTVAADPATLAEWSEISVCANCGAPAVRESHATVKPLEFMRWLVRLVTPVDGIVLEPFAGSGTTVEAAVLEGMRCIGIEREETYGALIAERMARAGLVAL